MNDGLVDLWNAQVGDDDVVYVVGDVVMGKTEETLRYVRALAGHKILVRGNHDRKRDHDYLTLGFDEVHNSLTRTLSGTKHTVSISHYPYTGDTDGEDRFVERRLTDRGGWLLCGHVHDRWRQRGRQINVGIDAWGGQIVDENILIELVAAGAQDRESLTWTTAALER